MRPLRLVMQAFGPYRDRQVVDFSELGPNRVFLVHGDTGAGKTTILDALVFALYGDTSGGERRAQQMRCESAPDTVPTEVMLDFALGERSYRIRRRPTQSLAGVRSASTLVTKQADVALWERTGCDPGEEGRPVALKVREADARVRALLGFSCDQFRQVVVLPQGRFRELLACSSDTREEILRQLFRTERFGALEARLSERAKQVRKDMEQLTMQRRAQLEVAGAADSAELLALIEGAAAVVEDSAGEMERAEHSLRLAVDALQAAQAAQAARRALAEARAHHDEIEARHDFVEAERARSAAAVRADKVRYLAEAHVQSCARFCEAQEQQVRVEVTLVQAREAEDRAVEHLAGENGRSAERRAAADRVGELERLEVALGSWREAERERAVAAGQMSEAEYAANKTKVVLEAAEKVLVGLKAAIETGKVAAGRLEVGRSRLQEAQRLEGLCQRIGELRGAIASAVESQGRLENAEAQALKELQAAETRVVAAEEGWKTGHAAVLAAGLKPGEPCPVCGSPGHPAPATVGPAVVSDGQLEEARAAAAVARDGYSVAHEAAVAGRAHLNNLSAQEGVLRAEMGSNAEVSLPKMSAVVVSERAGVAALEAEADIGGLEERLPEAAERVAVCARAVEAAEVARSAAGECLTQAETRLSERGRGVPEELREEGVLETALAEARRTAALLEETFASAAEGAAKAKETRMAAETARAAAAAAAQAALDQRDSARQGFVASLAANGFRDEEDWSRCLVAEEERIAIERMVVAYQEELQLAKGRLQQAQAAAEAQSVFTDIEVLQTAVAEARVHHDQALSAHADAKSHLAQLHDIRAGLAALDAKSDQIRAEYGTVGMLAEAAGGQNDSRVSFQRWVLGVYLDEVLVTAGRRLNAMSKGRYRFERQRETQSRRRPSGLDIAVFDEFSGTTRPAVTLSGGESFLAALALALGLAETVQEYSAGVPLETIFVDEGFGALDPDALQLAVDTLLELQMSGRLVGVISHVAELREVIPARLEVRGGSTGSSARFIVP